MIYRIDDELARQQAQWFVVGIVLFARTILLLRDVRVLERYRYMIAAVGHRAAGAAAAAGHRRAGERRLPGVDIGPLQFQPTEFAKLCIVVFLASYLQRARRGARAWARRCWG